MYKRIYRDKVHLLTNRLISFLWTIICLYAGIEVFMSIVNYGPKYGSILIPFYFMAWLAVLYLGHLVVQKVIDLIVLLLE